MHGPHFVTLWITTLTLGSAQGFLLYLLENHDHQGPFCPTQCSVYSPSDCLTGNTCSSHQYCAMHLTSDNIYKGICTGNSHYAQCQHDVNTYPCSSGFHFSHNTDCKMCCCKTSDCSNQCYRPTTTPPTTTPPTTTPPTTTPPTTTPPTTTPPTTTPPPTTAEPSTAAPTTAAPTTINTITIETVVTATIPLTHFDFHFSGLMTNCSDHMNCSELMYQESDGGDGDVCHETPGLCPESCGVCHIINSFDCHDTILNNGCQSEYVDNGICGDSLAQYACPMTCGLCDAILNRLIQKALE